MKGKKILQGVVLALSALYAGMDFELFLSSMAGLGIALIIIGLLEKDNE